MIFRLTEELFRLTEAPFKLTEVLFRLTDVLFRLAGVTFRHFAISCFKHAQNICHRIQAALSCQSAIAKKDNHKRYSSTGTVQYVCINTFQTLLRTFAPIATAHLQCARYSLVTHVPRHFQARARSPKLNKI